MKRRDFIVSSAALAGVAMLPNVAGAQAGSLAELRIGYQKSGVLLIAKAQALLEKRFAAQGTIVKWVEFQFGPPLLEALNTGSIDYGTTGDAPPIFAQAARANLNYVASLPGRGGNQAILVPPDSPIRSLADLKGRKIGVARASSAHNLLVSVLEHAGIGWDQIEPIYLAPADAASAFARGAIDAWSIWDPFYAIAELTRNARRLDIPPAVAVQNSYFLANRDFVTRRPDIVAAINTELAAASRWADTNRSAAAELFSQASGVDLAAQRRTVERSEFQFSPLNDTIIAQQQAVADRFHRLGLIPKPITVRDIVWTWKPAA